LGLATLSLRLHCASVWVS